MNATKQLRDQGQSIWLDNITRDLLDDGTLQSYIDDLSVSGLTSNPTIFDQAIKNSSAYDKSIAEKLTQGRTGEGLFFDLAIEDLARAADLFLPMHKQTNGLDGWVSLEVAPSLAYDAEKTVAAAKELHERAGRKNLFIKIPGTTQGLSAIEETIFAGIPVNVTLLFSAEHYLAAADAYLRGIERRITAGLNPHVESVASLFISRWDAAVAAQVPAELRNHLGIAIAQKAYSAGKELLTSARWLRTYNFGARPQRLLWASTGTKDPNASKLLYIESLVSPFTVNTMPEATLKALAQETNLHPSALEGGNFETVLQSFTKAGVDLDVLAARLQEEGAKSFVNSWNNLLSVISSKSALLATA